MMQRLRVGIVSGCLGAPMESVGKSELFHQVAARRLADRGIELRVSLRPIDEYRLDRMLGQLEFLAAERGCDLLAFQIRPTLLRHAAVVLWKDRRGGGWPRVRLCPYYQEDLNDWTPPEGLSHVERWYQANYALARWTGLQRRARMQVAYQLRAIAHHAREQLRRPLVFLGPMFNATLPPPIERYWTPILRHEMAAIGTPFVDLCDFRLATTPERFEPDGFHVNRHGHEIVGERFAAAVRP
ncbi:MAG: hypothetical protein ACKOOF_04010 [Planctomycetaceae bacterium]